MKISFVRILLSIIVVNAAGILLRYFDLDTYVIIIGFRFHLSFVLPLLFIFRKDLFPKAKIFFINPGFKRKFIPIIWIVFSIGSVLLLLFIFDKIKLADPDYLYEFGLSSIIDYPIYLVWNLPQAILLFFFLSFSTHDFKNKFIPVFLLIIFLFAHEFIPLNELIKVNYISFIELFLAALMAGIFFQFYENIYWFAVIFFSIFWSSLLAFGSRSETMVNILFAAQYDQWEGFFLINKDYSPYLISAHILAAILLLLATISKRKIKVRL